MKKCIRAVLIAWIIAFISIFYSEMVKTSTEETETKIEASETLTRVQETIIESSEESETVETPGDTVEVLYDDAQLLMRIAMAEANGDGVEGKAMVMAVVLNRVDDDRFPDNVRDVIYQPHQFSPISDGRFEKVEPDVECHLALAAIECGKYKDIDALYFENAVDSWQSKHCEYLYTVGRHKFYK